MSSLAIIPDQDEEPLFHHGDHPWALPDPISFQKIDVTSAVYFPDTKTLKVAITGIVDTPGTGSVSLIHDKTFKTGIKFYVVAMHAPSLPGAPKERKTARGRLQVEIPTKTKGFDDKRVVVETRGLDLQVYSVNITISKSSDPDAEKTTAADGKTGGGSTAANSI